jgi:hypothetical protein
MIPPELNGMKQARNGHTMKSVPVLTHSRTPSAQHRHTGAEQGTHGVQCLRLSRFGLG